MDDSRRLQPVHGGTENAPWDESLSAAPTDRLSRRVAAGYAASGAIVAAFLLVASGGAALGQAATPQAQGSVANYFVLNGENTQISYATTSLSGVPQLTYQGQFGSHSFSGEQIDHVDTDIGELVMVRPLQVIPDLWEVSLTLLVPDVNLVAGGAETPIATVAILTTHNTSIGGPQLVQGALQTYETVALQGTAEFVIS